MEIALIVLGLIAAVLTVALVRLASQRTEAGTPPHSDFDIGGNVPRRIYGRSFEKDRTEAQRPQSTDSETIDSAVLSAAVMDIHQRTKVLEKKGGQG